MNMKSMAAACLMAIVSMAAQAKDYKYESVRGDMMNTCIYTLDNGLKVYLSVNKEKPRIQTYIAVRTGSRNDPAETTGLAHYLEHIMFKGTTSFGTSDAAKEAPLLDSIQNRYEVYRTLTDPEDRRRCYRAIDSLSQVAAQYNIPNEYDKLMSAIGAQGTNAYTGNDVTCYTEDIPSNEVENWAKVQSDRFQNMVVRGFHTELEAVYEEYNIGIANDMSKVWKAMFAKLFPNHPYGTQTTIGTQEHLKNPSIVNIKNYFKMYYVPNNVAICLSGDLDPERTVEIIDRYFGGWKADPNLSYPEYEPVKKLTAPVDTTVMGKEAELLMLAWQLDKAASAQADTVEVLSYLLQNGTAGMFDLDINQNMLCAEAGAFHSFLNEYSMLVLYGRPKEGQTLDEVKTVMLDEIGKLRRGDFDDDLIQSVINNLKLNYYRNIEDNGKRADMYVDAFINNIEWERVVTKFDRMSKFTKKDIIDFANRHFGDNYVAVYKRTGEDGTLRKIDKPQITAIPANRDMQSKFVGDMLNSIPEPIQPRFLDFKTDLSYGKTKKGMPVMYVKNTTNGTFTLCFRYGFGEESDMWLPFAADYLDYLGTSKMTAEQLKKKFYSLACKYNVSVGAGSMNIIVSGLADNMAEALALTEDFLANAKVDTAAYRKYVDVEIKTRKDNKLDQKANFSALYMYGLYGPYNALRNVPGNKALLERNPRELIDMVKAVRNYEHEVYYYGPAEMEEVISAVDKHHKTAKKLMPVPTGKEYTEQQTPRNEILIAPYEAKNIYMRQCHNEGRMWSPDKEVLVSLFNEYYGGGMNSVVFQELRESRALAYNAWANYFTPSRKGHPEFTVTHIISQNDKLLDCINAFNGIIDTIPQSEKAFELAKQALTKRLAAARTTKFGILNAYIKAKNLGIDYDINEKIYNALPSVKLSDVVEFERERMASKPYLYMILGDEKELDIKSLEKIAPIRRVTTDEIFGY